jgi:hypothetical protein
MAVLQLVLLLQVLCLRARLLLLLMLAQTAGVWLLAHAAATAGRVLQQVRLRGGVLRSAPVLPLHLALLVQKCLQRHSWRGVPAGQVEAAHQALRPHALLTRVLPPSGCAAAAAVAAATAVVTAVAAADVQGHGCMCRAAGGSWPCFLQMLLLRGFATWLLLLLLLWAAPASWPERHKAQCPRRVRPRVMAGRSHVQRRSRGRRQAKLEAVAAVICAGCAAQHCCLQGGGGGEQHAAAAAGQLE